MNWIPANSRRASPVFICSACRRRVYAQQRRGSKSCDYLYCPYCGQLAEDQDGQILGQISAEEYLEIINSSQRRAKE